MGTEEMTRRKNTKLILVDARLREYDIYNIYSRPLVPAGDWFQDLLWMPKSKDV